MQLKAHSPVRVDLGDGGVAICDPIESPDYLRGQAAARAVVRAGVGDVQATARYALIAALVHRPFPDAPPEVHGGVRELEGVADVDGTVIVGQPTPEQIDRLLKWYPAYEAFERVYAGPILEAEAEKNGFAPSRGGSSTPRAAKPTAKAARKTGAGGARSARRSSTDPAPLKA